ncbi:MAG: hypothetical protein A2275_09420 [Bacteroidetes bacterium RIFOXYA12_FULL_35_11]|nr:MAG: hypothetical protein A2X01_01045 [Bacteroidetes bacterium GWF2_35_48]OFY76112.1 MAG: hypothetical protein A2275_09420 [Bacteroidetes bacterium RIFOXYA12_FULL_35_11]
MLEAFHRFPVTILLAIGVSGVAIYLSELHYPENAQAWKFYAMMISGFLAAIGFIALNLFIEQKQIKSPKKDIINAIALLLFALYFIILPEKLTALDYLRFALLAIGMHLLVAFAPFIKAGNINAFWQFNKSLFLRLLTGGIYSVVLYIGLALALLAIENLFGVRISSKTYFKLWIVITGIFNTWFFLAGIPKNLQLLEQETSYPKGLKVFSQYVLISLILVYFIILYSYSIKILIQWQLPEGWVSYLVTGFAGLGVFTLLLLYPVQTTEENKWIKRFSRFFHIALLPLLILLYIAIIRRISDYGITENRYFVFALALWLTGITLYLLFSKNKNIKLIPLTLCIITFAGSFGPWGAFSVSEKSQLGRFEKLLKENNLLVNGKISKTEKELPFKTRQAISSVVEYLTEYRNYNILQPYYKQNLDSLFPDTAYKSKPQELLSIMGVSYVSRWEREENYNEHFYFSTNRDNKYNIIKIDTFQYMISFNEYYNDYYKDSLFSNKYSGENIKAVITKKAKENFFRICFNDTVCEDIRLDTIIDKLNKNPQSYTYNIETKEMTLIKNTENISIKFVFSNIGGIKKNDSIIINTMGGDLFFNLREKK